MKPLVYVAGPYASPDPVLNVRRACVVADRLVEAGAAVFVPHLSMLWHLTSPAGVDDWNERDLDVLDHCDALVRFYGESEGADREWRRATELGIERWHLGKGNDRLLGVSLPRWIREWANSAPPGERPERITDAARAALTALELNAPAQAITALKVALEA